MRSSFLFIGIAIAGLVPLDGAMAAGPTTTGCLTASESALALGAQHKLRARRSQLLICASQSCPADVRVECARNTLLDRMEHGKYEYTVGGPVL